MKIDRNKLSKQTAPDAGNYITAMFSSGGGAQPAEVPLERLSPWQDAEHSRQPFRPYPMEKLRELAENIAQYGVLSPIFVRPYESGYQILAGHNRVAAAKLAGLTTIPAVVREVDDDTAKLVLTDSNLYQREKLLPSEKAWAYRIRLDAIRRKAGRPAQNNSRQVGENYSVDIL
ncbi:MAG: ParB/RepB/Spo0J family partition protein, partial [Lawsonibacter sp.]